MGRRQFTREFKIEAVRLVRDRGVSIAQASRDLDVHENVIRKWVRDFAADPGQLSGPRHDEARAGRDRALEARSPEAQVRARHSKKSRGLRLCGAQLRCDAKDHT
jgi:transposase